MHDEDTQLANDLQRHLEDPVETIIVELAGGRLWKTLLDLENDTIDAVDNFRLTEDALQDAA